jgi:CCR4-NOT transcription complex subunit 7/8
MLKSYGINFDTLQSQGISMEAFGEQLLTSGLILNENVRWITFHGSYDFAYLLKIITGLNLPLKKSEFQKDLELYFTNFFDIRVLVKSNENFSRCSLQRLAFELGIARIGIQHQAGSDSLLTGEIFFKLIRDYVVEWENDVHSLYGFELNSVENEYLGYNNFEMGNQYQQQKSQYDFNMQQQFYNLNQINYHQYFSNNLRNNYSLNNFYAGSQYTAQPFNNTFPENSNFQPELSKAEEVKKKKIILKNV